MERASSVVAAPVGTDPGENLTLIHIWAVAARTGEGWKLPGAAPLGLRSPKLSLGVWEETQLASRAGESLGRFGVQRRGVSVSISKTPAPRTCTCPSVAAEVDPRWVGSCLPSQESPFLRAKPWAQPGSVGGGSRNRDSVRLSNQAPVTCSTPALSLNGHLGRPNGHPWRPPRSLSRGPHGVTHLAVLAGAPPGSPQGGTALGPQGGSA